MLREAARTSRRWQTYASRAAFSGVLMGVLLIGMWGAVEATRTAAADTADLGQLGRWLFTSFSIAQILLALIIAPLSSAGAIVEETDERTMEMLVLTPLSPGQILAAKIVSRILVLVTVVFGALPVMALVVNLGGVSAVEVLAVTAHTLTTVVILAALGAFFALFTKSPALATMASASYAIPFFGLLPMAYVICTGIPEHATHFSTFAAGIATDWTALVTPLSYVPSLFVIFAVATPLFRLKVSSADFRHAFSEDIWRTRAWLAAAGIWFAVACFSLPVAVPLSWGTKSAASAGSMALNTIAGAWIWLLFAFASGLGTWAFLRVGMDVVDGVDGVFSGAGLGPQHERASKIVGRWPVWWREARPAAWMSTAAPMFVTWALVMLAVFQTGWWIVPGGLLAIGAINGAASVLFAGWLASKSVVEERRRGTLEVLLATTMSAAQIASGKLAGAAMPTAPLLLLSLPLFMLGVPHLAMLQDTSQSWWWLALRGALSWLWLVPLWLLAIVISMTAATQTSRPQSAFAATAIAAGAFYGIPAVAARAMPDSLWVTMPARIIAPPLAGSFTLIELALSLAITTFAAIVLLWRYVSNMRRWVGALALLLALGLGWAPSASAQDPNDPDEITKLERINRLRMVARPIADGLAREGSFTALHVTVENAGPGTVGTLSLSERTPAIDGSAGVSTLFQREIELPEGTRRSVILLVRVGIGDPNRTLELSTREGRIAQAPFTLRPLSPPDVSLGVVGTDPLGLPAVLREAAAGEVPGKATRVASDRRQVRTGLVLPEAMPEHSAGYSSIDWLIWPSADPSSLQRAQIEALLAWVADGGHLLIIASDTWRQISESPLSAALPLSLTGQEESDIAPLRQRLGMLDAGPVPVAKGELSAREGAPPVVVRATTDGGTPLWASQAYGLGSIHIVTAELKGELRGQEDPWRRLLTLPPPDGYSGDLLAKEPDAPELRAMMHLDPALMMPPEGFQGAEATWEANIRDHLDDIPGVSPLPLSWLVAFAVVYLLAIGPVDYLFLRLIGRQPLTWVTFPFLIVAFSAGSLAMTQYTKGSQAVVVRVEVADLLPGTALARGTTWLSVFSTRKTRLSLTGGYPDSTVSPLLEPGFQNAPTIRAGAGPGELSYGAETWTLAYARSDWTTALAPLTVSRDEATQQLTVENTLPFALDELGVLWPSTDAGVQGGLVRLGAMPKGGKLVVPDAPVVEPLSGALMATDPLAWAANHLHDDLPASRGRLDAEHRPVLIGVARNKTLEKIELVGLSPVERPTFVVRQPLPPLPRRASPPQETEGIPEIYLTPTISGALDKELVNEVVKRHMNQIRYCYQRELTRDPTLGGKVAIELVISSDGTVSSAVASESTLNNASVESCITGRFLRMQFPAPQGGGIVVVTYPFLFQPG